MTFKLHREILPPAQQQLWPALWPTTQLNFVLYGGTAVALRLGHRLSVDFDFFSAKPLDYHALRTAFPFITHATTLQEQPNTLSVLVHVDSAEPVKVSFFGDIDFGRVGEPDMSEDGVLYIASLEDLMATKVKVILQRVEAKDYRDIAAMINSGVSLARGLAAARALYGATFQPSESLKAITYFEGGDLYTLTNEEKTSLVHAASSVRNLPNVTLLSRQLTG